ncbi:MAG: type VI secretion protein, partial [Frankia sp.]
MTFATPPAALAAPPTPPASPGPGGLAGWLTGLLSHPHHHTAHHALHVALGWAPIAAGTLAVLAAAIVGVRVAVRGTRRERLAVHARLVTLLPPPRADLASAEAFWGQLVGLLRPPVRRFLTGQPHVVFTYAWTPGELVIALWVPGVIPPGLVERAAEAAWPGARTTTAPAEADSFAGVGVGAVGVVAAGVVAAGGRLRLARPDVLPLRTDHHSDPLRALLGAATGLTDSDTVVVQVLARPATGRRLVRARRTAAAMRGGAPARPVSRALDLLSPGPTGPASAPRPPADPERTAESRAMLAKAASPRYATEVRYLITTDLDIDPNTYLDRSAWGRRRALHQARAAVRGPLRGRAHAVASSFALFSGPNYYRRRRLHHPSAAFARRDLGRGDLLSVPELAGLAHLPLDTAVPGLARAGAQAVPPPVGVPGPGPGVKTLGRAQTAGRPQVGLPVADAAHHLHVIGATGSGKSTLTARMILDDQAAGRGLVAVDPKGDQVRDILDRLPLSAARRLVLFDPDQPGPPPCVNILDGPDPDLA